MVIGCLHHRHNTEKDEAVSEEKNGTLICNKSVCNRSCLVIFWGELLSGNVYQRELWTHIAVALMPLHGIWGDVVMLPFRSRIKQNWDASVFFFACVQQEMKIFLQDTVNSKCYQVQAGARRPHPVRLTEPTEQISSPHTSILLLPYFSRSTVWSCVPSSIQWFTDQLKIKHHSEAESEWTWGFFRDLAASPCPHEDGTQTVQCERMGSIQHGIQLVSKIIKHVPDVIQNVPCGSHSVESTVIGKRRETRTGSESYINS